jgi:4-amino-4-deoxy-L-arabinose transferase-like glycosyltransferase
MSVLGQNPWGARLFVVLGAFATALITVQLAREFGFEEIEARLAGVVQATAIFPFIGGHIFTTDGFTMLWQAFAALCAWRVWNGRGSVHGWRILFWAAMALAFMTKGPPACFVAIPLVVMNLLRREPARSAKLFSITGLLLFLVLSSSWFVYVIWHDPHLLRYFIEYEVIDRVATSVHNRDNPFYVYIPLMIAGMFPWMGGWVRVARRLRDGWQAGDYALRYYSAPGAFTIIWLASSLVIFMIAESRLPLYVLPLTVPCSIWMAKFFVRFQMRKIIARPRLATALQLGFAIYLIALGGFQVFAGLVATKRTERPLALSVRRMVESNPAIHPLYSSPEDAGDAPYSLDFNLRGALRCDVGTKNLAGLAITRDEAGTSITVPISLVKRTQIKKMRDRGVSFLLLGDGVRYAAVTLPEASDLFPKAKLYVGKVVDTEEDESGEE